MTLKKIKQIDKGSVEKGIRAKIFEGQCLACHSSEKTGAERRNAPIGIDYDTYSVAVASGASAVTRAVTMVNMPPDFSPLPKLDEAQTQALKNWEALGFPEHSLPPIYSSETTLLTLPKVYIKDVKGDIVQKLTAELAIIPNQETIQFELTEFAEVTGSNEHDHNHP